MIVAMVSFVKVKCVKVVRVRPVKARVWSVVRDGETPFSVVCALG